MVKAEDSWLFQQDSACHLPNLNCTSTPLQHGQQNVLASYTDHFTIPADVAFPGFRVPDLCGLGTSQTNGAPGLFWCLPPRLESLPSTLNPYVKEETSAFNYGHGIKAMPNAVSGSTQKKLLIFDQSGNHTRLLFSPLCSPAQNQIVAPTNYINACDLRDKGQPAEMEQNFLTKPTTIHKKSDENQIIGEGSEMHEDTEEINALLYSDDDGDDSDEDEVTSTGRSPVPIEGNYKKRELMEEITTEVASPDCPMKKQRLIGGGYKKSSLMDIVSSTKLDRLCKYDNNAELSANGRTQGEDLDAIIGSKQSRKDKIRETLKILESLIPGVKSKDPLLVIEEAISYLKYLKLKAKALGVSQMPLRAAPHP